MSKVISADVPDDLAERVEESREEGESRSAAVRRLVRTGLDADNSNAAVPTIILTTFGAVTLGIAIDPVAPPEFLVAVAGVAFAIAAFLSRTDR